MMDVRLGGKTLNAIKVRIETTYSSIYTRIKRYKIYYYLPSECDGRTFGQNCSQICGKCLNNEQCHHINGRCLNGCVSGYGGTNCTEGTDKTIKVFLVFLSFVCD